MTTLENKDSYLYFYVIMIITIIIAINVYNVYKKKAALMAPLLIINFLSDFSNANVWLNLQTALVGRLWGHFSRCLMF